MKYVYSFMIFILGIVIYSAVSLFGTGPESFYYEANYKYKPNVKDLGTKEECGIATVIDNLEFCMVKRLYIDQLDPEGDPDTFKTFSINIDYSPLEEIWSDKGGNLFRLIDYISKKGLSYSDPINPDGGTVFIKDWILFNDGTQLPKSDDIKAWIDAYGCIYSDVYIGDKEGNPDLLASYLSYSVSKDEEGAPQFSDDGKPVLPPFVSDVIAPTVNHSFLIMGYDDGYITPEPGTGGGDSGDDSGDNSDDNSGDDSGGNDNSDDNTNTDGDVSSAKATSLKQESTKVYWVQENLGTSWGYKGVGCIAQDTLNIGLFASTIDDVKVIPSTEDIDFKMYAYDCGFNLKYKIANDGFELVKFRFSDLPVEHDDVFLKGVSFWTPVAGSVEIHIYSDFDKNLDVPMNEIYAQPRSAGGAGFFTMDFDQEVKVPAKKIIDGHQETNSVYVLLRINPSGDADYNLCFYHPLEDEDQRLGMGVGDFSEKKIKSGFEIDFYPVCVEFLNNNYVAMADETSKLYILNVDDPDNVLLASTYQLSQIPQKMLFVKDNYLYIVSYEGSLYVLDISNKQSPFMKKTISFNKKLYDLACNENYLFISNNEGGIYILDITDKGDPVYLNEYKISGVSKVSCIAVKDNYLYAATGDTILKGFSISDITNISETGFSETLPDKIYEMKIVGNYLAIANGTNGAVVYALGDPINPVNLGNVNMCKDPDTGDDTQVDCVTGIDIYQPLSFMDPVIYAASGSTGVLQISVGEGLSLISQLSKKEKIFKVRGIGRYCYFLYKYDFDDPDCAPFRKNCSFIATQNNIYLWKCVDRGADNVNQYGNIPIRLYYRSEPKTSVSNKIWHLYRE